MNTFNVKAARAHVERHSGYNCLSGHELARRALRVQASRVSHAKVDEKTQTKLQFPNLITHQETSL